MAKKSPERTGWFLTSAAIPRPRKTLRDRIDGAADFVADAASGISFLARKTKRQTAAIAASAWNAVLATPVSLQIDLWLGHAFDGAATSYDKAMDAVYNATHEGGGWHRLVDGGHDLAGAWRAIAQAHPDDEFLQTMAGYVQAVWKDMVTPRGLPLVTISQDSLKSFHQFGDALGISHVWINDMLSYTATELTGAVTGVVAIVLNLHTDDKHRLAELVGSLGVSALVGANPLLGIITILALAKTLKNMRDETTLHLAKGGLGSAAFLGACSLLSGHVWLGLMVGLVASILVHKAGELAIEKFRQQDWTALKRAWDQGLSLLAANRISDLLPKPAPA